jgi:hypothetical protein
MTNALSLLIASASLLASIGSVCTAMIIYRNSTSKARIDNFATRYLSIVSARPQKHNDSTRLGAIIEAGILWLKDNSEARTSLAKLHSIGVLHPFQDKELARDIIGFCAFVRDRGELNIDAAKYIALKFSANEQGINI